MTDKLKTSLLEKVARWEPFSARSREKNPQGLSIIYSFIPGTDENGKFYQRFAAVKGGDRIMHNYALSQDEVRRCLDEIDRPKKLTIKII
jgi:hypothetical protein